MSYVCDNNPSYFICIKTFRLRIYNWKKLSPLAYLNYHTDTVNAMDFSDDLPDYGQLLAAGGKDARISLWSLYNEKRQSGQDKAS